ncbi:hypothetical protein BH11MYX4_BH11MYX4_32880 [soil metagenome]
MLTIRSTMDAFTEHRALAEALGVAGLVLSLLASVGGTLLVRRALLEMPADLDRDHGAPLSPTRGALRTAAGFAVFAAGLVLLVLPGPGLLLMALGLLMVGTRRQGGFVRACLARPRLRRAVNALRARHGRPALSDSGSDGRS